MAEKRSLYLLTSNRGKITTHNAKGKELAARHARELADHVAKGDALLAEQDGRVASVKKGLYEAGERSGVRGVSAHVFRHTAAVWMAESGVRMEEIAQFLGHADMKVTEKHYARFSPDFLRGAASALEF